MDLLLVTGIILLAILTLSVRMLFTSIVLFISLGLLATIMWVRLNAWDVAISEAAIGAGVTGALMLMAWKRTSTKAGKH